MPQTANFASKPLVSIEDKLKEAFSSIGDVVALEQKITPQDTYRQIFDYFERENQFSSLVSIPDEKQPMALTRHLLAQHLPKYYKTYKKITSEVPAVPQDIYLPTLPPHELTAKLALQVIQQGNGLVKTVGSLPTKNEHWDFLLEQLNNPERKRPFIPNPRDRNRVFNPKTGQQVERITTTRGTSKNTPFLKKTATTLLPPNGVISLFKRNTIKIVDVGILWDLSYCHLKGEKYVFAEEAYTFTLKPKLWFGAPRSVGIDKIRQQNEHSKSPGETLKYNEILASPSKQGVRAIFAIKDEPEARLNALRIRQYVIKKGGLALPLLIQTDTQPITEYSIEQQIKDIDQLRQSRRLSATNRQLIKDFYSHYQKALTENTPVQQLFSLSYLDYVLTLPAEEREKILEQDYLKDFLTSQHVDEHGCNSLHLAAQTGYPRTIKFLIESASVNVHLKDKEGNTPLHYACNVSPKAARVLIAHGANLNVANNAGRKAEENRSQYKRPPWFKRGMRYLITMILFAFTFLPLYGIWYFAPLLLTLLFPPAIPAIAMLLIISLFFAITCTLIIEKIPAIVSAIEVAILPVYQKWCRLKESLWPSHKNSPTIHAPTAASAISHLTITPLDLPAATPPEHTAIASTPTILLHGQKDNSFNRPSTSSHSFFNIWPEQPCDDKIISTTENKPTMHQAR